MNNRDQQLAQRLKDAHTAVVGSWAFKLTDFRRRAIKLYAELERGYHRQQIAEIDHRLTAVIDDHRGRGEVIALPSFLKRQGD